MIRRIDDKEASFLFNIARIDDHRNSKNYQEKRIKDYLAIHVYENDRDIIAFSGVFPFQDNFCRVADRTFVMKEYRSKGLNSLGHGQFLSRNLLPVQTKLALELGYTPFYSIQERKRRKSLELSVDDFNRHNNDSYYRVLDGMYYTCDEYVEGNENCWQNVAVLGDQSGIKFRNTFRHRV
tara:strand:- start:1398 stop:1937 length:540 start_codon:yes stop_codon:yes gene_type:complete